MSIRKLSCPWHGPDLVCPSNRLNTDTNHLGSFTVGVRGEERGERRDFRLQACGLLSVDCHQLT